MGLVDQCLTDTGCLAATVAAITAGVAACKRLYAVADQTGWGDIRWILTGARRLGSGAAINGATSSAGAVLAVELAGLSPKVAACLAVLAVVAIDYASVEGRAIVSRFVSRAAGLPIDERRPPSEPPSAS
jgi:hypothetical protein